MVSVRNLIKDNFKGDEMPFPIVLKKNNKK
jgi:hypothetical protein